MSEEILWLVYASPRAPECKLASRRNAVIVSAATPADARAKADSSNAFGEVYRAGFLVVALHAVIEACDGVLAVKGDLANPPPFEGTEPFCF